MTKARLTAILSELGSKVAFEDFQSAIMFETLSGREKATTMTISVTDADAEFATQAATLMTDAVLAEHQVIEDERVQSALAFFKQEVRDRKSALNKSFETLLDFKVNFAGFLPTDASRYLDQRKALLMQQASDQVTLPADPVRKKLIAEMAAASALYSGQHPKIRALAAQLKDTAARANAPTTDASSVQEDIERIDLALALIPANSLRLTALEDDHNMAQDQYEGAVSRLESAAVEERIAQRADGERLSVVQAAILPTLPSGPRQKIALALGLMLSTLLAISAAVARIRLDKVIRRPRDLQTSLNLIPFAVIPAK